MNIVILGAVFGDEGKGAIAHYLSTNYDWIVRYNGGANAGHTLYRDGVKYVHNLLPSFDWRSPRPKAYLASNMVIDLDKLYSEIVELSKINSTFPSRVYVDLDAFVVEEKHIEADKNKNKHIGSTNRGIGPAYEDKIGRRGKRVRDFDLTKLKELGVNFTTVLEQRLNFIGSDILFEGAQGVLLDINHGTYPYVSSSDSTLAGIYASGFGFIKIDKVYGIAKVYSTRVGEGPFPTELFGDEAEELRKIGKEYGATTGRPRRVGWLDLPALEYVIHKTGITDLVFTKFDIVQGQEIKICTNYQNKITSGQDLFNPGNLTYSNLKWNDCNIESIKEFIDLIERRLNTKISIISHGINKEDIKILK